MVRQTIARVALDVMIVCVAYLAGVLAESELSDTSAPTVHLTAAFTAVIALVVLALLGAEQSCHRVIL